MKTKQNQFFCKIISGAVLFLCVFSSIEAQPVALKLSVQTGHAGPVHSLSFNADGSKLASGGADNQVILWDMKNGRQIQRFDAEASVLQVSLHPKLPLVAAITGEKTLFVWDLNSGGIVFKQNNAGKVAAFHPEGSTLVSGDRSLDVLSWKESGESGAASRTVSLAFSPDGNRIAFGDPEKTDLKTFGERGSSSYKGRADAVAFSGDGSILYSADLAGSLRAYDLSTGKQAFSLTSYRKAAGFTSLAANNNLLVATLSDGAIQFYNPQNGKIIDYLIAFDGAARSSSFSPDGKLLAIGNQYGEIFLWEAATRELVFLLTGITRKINVMTFSEDGNHLFLGYDDGNFKYWDYRPNGKVLTNKLEKRIERSSDRWQYKVDQKPYVMTDKEIRFIVSMEQRMADPSNPRPRKVFDYDVRWNLKTNTISASQHRKKAVLKGGENTVTMNSYYRRDGEYRKNRRIINNIWPVGYTIASGGVDGGDAFAFYLFLGGVYNLATLYPQDKFYSQSGGKPVKVIDQDFRTRKRLAAHKISEDGALVAASVESHEFVRLWPTAVMSGYSLYDKNRFEIPDTKPERFQLLLFDMKSGRKIDDISSYEPVTEFGLFKNRWLWVLKAEMKDQKLLVIDAVNGKEIFDKPSRHAASFSPDGNRLIWVNNDNRLVSTDLSTGESQTFDGIGDTRITSIDYRSDGKFIAAAGSDGLIRLFDGQTGANLVTMAGIGSEDFMYITPKNEYYVSKGALRGVGYTINGQIYPFDQFDVLYNRPDKIMEALRVDNEEIKQFYYFAWQKRLEKLGMKESDLSFSMNDLPELTVSGGATLRTQEATFKLNVTARDRQVPLKTLHVWVSAVPEFGVAGRQINENQAGVPYSEEISVALNPGVNLIEVRVDNAAGRSSLKQILRVNYVPEAAPKSKLFLLAVGSSTFRDASQNLNFAAKDAGDLVSAMKSAGTFSSVETKVILNEEVSRDNVASARDFLKQAGVNDVVMVFFAGHGMLDTGNNLFLSTYGVDFENPQDGGIPYREVEALLDGIASRQKILFLDACHSGEFDADAEQAQSSELVQKGGKVLQRGLTAKKTSKTAKSGYGKAFELSKLLFADLRESNGAVVISAAGGAEFAFEGGTFKNGVFTYALINGMKNKKADLNKDGRVEASELARFLSAEVSRLTNGRQTPTSRVENLQHDFVVY